MGYFERTDRIKELELLLKIKEIVIGDYFCILENSFLSLYLLRLSLGNPMPAHYYNPTTKEVIFDDSKEFGADLPKKANFIKDGFAISEDYTINLEEKFFIDCRVNSKYKEEVLQIVKEYFPEEKFSYSFTVQNSNFKVKSNEVIKEVKYANSLITFMNFPNFENFDKELSNLDMDNLKRYLLGPYYKNQFLDCIDSDGIMKESLYLLEKDFKHETVEDLAEIVYLQGYVDTYYNNKNIVINPNKRKFPTNRQDIFVYLKAQGHDNKEAANIARDLS